MTRQVYLALFLMAGGASEFGSTTGPYATCSSGWVSTACAAGFTLYDIQGQQAGYGTPHFGGLFLVYDVRGNYQGYAKQTPPDTLDMYDAHSHWRGTLGLR